MTPILHISTHIAYLYSTGNMGIRHQYYIGAFSLHTCTGEVNPYWYVIHVYLYQTPILHRSLFITYLYRRGKPILVCNCNKFYCNLTFYKLNTYLILTSACLVLWSKNVSTDKNFLRNILVTRGDPFVCACPRMRRTHCRQVIVERSSLYFWSPENKLCGEVGWVYPCEDKVSI